MWGKLARSPLGLISRCCLNLTPHLSSTESVSSRRCCSPPFPHPADLTPNRLIGIRRRLRGELTGQAKINTLHTFVVQGVEVELANAFGIEHRDRPQYFGRALPPKFVWRHAGGAPNAQRPASDRMGRLYRLAQRRLEDILWAASRGQNQLLIYSVKLASRDLELIQGSYAALGPRWNRMFASGFGPWMLEEVRNWAEFCLLEADKLEQEAGKAHIKGFRDWACKATMAGGGAAHAYCKLPKAWRAALVPDGPHPGSAVGQSSEPQKVVDAELLKWQSGPWNATMAAPEELPPWPLISRLTPIRGEEIREASRHYSWRTGLSLDQLHPKHLAILSDEALHALSCFLYCCELAGVWADAMGFFAFFLLHESTGGVRTIGLLSCFYRIDTHGPG